MKNINFVLLGEYSIAKVLGKIGTSSDISIYDKKDGEDIYTWTIPISYPDKIQSLLQSINMGEYAIINVTKIDKYLGEQIIALDSLSISDGLIVFSYDVDENKLKSLINGTSVENFRFVQDLDSLKQEILNLTPKEHNGPLIIPIDHAFEVKGVGTVILGVIKQGQTKIHDELEIYPHIKKVLVKSIQMHDDSVIESKSPSRVGLALKGISADEISRGDVLSISNYLVKSDTKPIKTKFVKNKFFREEITETQTYFISVGLQIKPVKIKIKDDYIEIFAEKPFAYYPEQKFIIGKSDTIGIRIIGSGKFSEL